MARRLEADNLRISPREGIAVGGRTIIATFDGRKFRGSGLLRARYLLLPGDPFIFNNPEPDGEAEAFLGPSAVTQGARPYSKELVLKKRAGGARLLRLDIRLEVVEVDENDEQLGDPTEEFFHVPIKRGTSSRLSRMRASLGMSQADLAGELGVSRSTISRLEQGGTTSQATLRKLPKSMEHGVEELKD